MSNPNPTLDYTPMFYTPMLMYAIVLLWCYMLITKIMKGLRLECPISSIETYLGEDTERAFRKCGHGYTC